MYTVIEAAKRLGVSQHTVRYYHKEGLLPFVQQDEKGYRRFTDSDVELMQMELLYVRAGMSIKRMRALLEAAVLEDDPAKGLLMLQLQLEDLHREIEEMQRKSDFIKAAILRYEEEIRLRETARP